MSQFSSSCVTLGSYLYSQNLNFLIYTNMAHNIHLAVLLWELNEANIIKRPGREQLLIGLTIIIDALVLYIFLYWFLKVFYILRNCILWYELQIFSPVCDLPSDYFMVLFLFCCHGREKYLIFMSSNFQRLLLWLLIIRL